MGRMGSNDWMTIRISRELGEYIAMNRSGDDSYDDVFRRMLGLKPSAIYIRKQAKKDPVAKQHLPARKRTSKYRFMEMKVNEVMTLTLNYKDELDLEHKMRNMFSAMYYAQRKLKAIYNMDRLDEAVFRFTRWE